jgi:hypothetical protein
MKYITIILLFVCLIAKSTTYYVAPSGGNDNNTGAIGQPWATWQKAFNSAQAGDTVYFRDGVWYLGTNDYVVHNPSTSHGYNGTYTNPICFFNYPNEIPILDAIGHTNTSDGTAFEVTNSTYLKFRGLTIRNQRQHTGVSDQWIASMEIYENGNLYFDRMTCHSGGGYGFWFSGYDTLYLTNCDSYDHCDTIRADGELGNRSDGFQISSGSNEGDYTYINGCRSWNNSDDGIEINTGEDYLASNIWVFNNGRYSHGAGTGIKFGPASETTYGSRVIRNCLAAFNRGNGFSDQNLIIENVGPINHFFNNTAYRCRFGFDSDQGSFNCATGYTEELFRNNLAYQSTYGVTNGNYPSYYTVYLTLCADQSNHAVQDHNSWVYQSSSPYWLANPAFTISNTDFAVIDSATGINQLLATRKSDGSLPDVTFLTLLEGSDLIDAGVDIGLPYGGDAPDIGYAEYGDIIENTTPIVGNIPNQTIISGESFSTIHLDGYVTDSEDADNLLTWTYLGNSLMTVTIVNRVATVAYPNGYTGSITITFRATDTGYLYDTDAATYTVTPVSTSCTRFMKSLDGKFLKNSNGNFLKH